MSGAAVVVAVVVVGELVTFKVAPSDRTPRCGRVVYVQDLPGGNPSCWIVETGAAPHRTLHMRLVDVHKGCAA